MNYDNLIKTLRDHTFDPEILQNSSGKPYMAMCVCNDDDTGHGDHQDCGDIQVENDNHILARIPLHFDDDLFLTSVNKAKWNIYTVSLQDLTLYSLSYLSVFLIIRKQIKQKKYMKTF